MTEGVASALGNLAAGSALGRYELLLPVAQGGMATVWAARMKGTRGFSKIVAIKTMLPALSKDPRFETMFLSEAELASRIKHPHVCEILDLGEQDGVLYLAMEWIDGDSLVTLASDCERAGKRVPFSAAARIGADVARGLHAAHELKDDAGALVGVVHRDVSPHNILVTADGLVKVVDFGVAKAMARSDHQVTNAGHLKGKVQFMAPEQAFCDEVDRRTDVFALGIVLYQLTTGTHPFRADNELATLARITSPDPVPAPSTLVPDYPPELSAVVMKALSKQRDERYASMVELGDALEAVAIQLTAGEGARAVETFLREALAPRAEKRAAELKEALRAADEREGQRTLSGMTSQLSASSQGLPRVYVPEEGEEDLLTGMTRPGKRGRSMVVAAGFVVLGAVMGGAAFVWVSRSGGGAAGTAGVEAGTAMGSAVATATATATASATANANATANATGMDRDLNGPGPGATATAAGGDLSGLRPGGTATASTTVIGTASGAAASGKVKAGAAPKGTAAPTATAGKFRSPGF
jgi:eukaryotic-like serine/threonine-protein kinase